MNQKIHPGWRDGQVSPEATSGSTLKLHVIATTNAPVQRLDEALPRPGRLMA